MLAFWHLPIDWQSKVTGPASVVSGRGKRIQDEPERREMKNGSAAAGHSDGSEIPLYRAKACRSGSQAGWQRASCYVKG